MSTYRVATNHDVALGSLTELDPQPDPGPGIQTTRRSYAADGTVVDEGKYIELHWGALESQSAYSTLLGVFGLNSSTTTADVTVYVRDETYSFVRMNGKAHRPIPGETVTWGDRQSRPLDVTILVTNLEAAA